MRKVLFENSVASNTSLMRDWDMEKNIDPPEDVSLHSGRKVFWKCEKGHSWEAQVGHRTNGSECPYCAGRKVLKGFNDLATTNPDVAAQWDYERNDDSMSPFSTSRGSVKEVWWKCEHGHEWKARPLNRTVSHQGCPYCSGLKAISGENDLETLYPEIAAQLDTELNGDIRAKSLLPHSNKKLFWKCGKGHIWKTQVNSRIRGDGCPYCSGLKAVPGENDLETLYPEIAAQWVKDKNDRKPSEIGAGSSYRAVWKCELGHEWEMVVDNRTNGHQGCPYCAGRKVLEGFNDLLSQRPDVAAQWDYEKNGELRPEHFTKTSGKRVWWKCEHGHEFYVRIADRTFYSTKCPKCVNADGSSNEEKELAQYIGSILPKGCSISINDRTILGGKELDIYIPSLNIAFEFNGLYWHSEQAGKDRNYHYDKWLACKNAGIQLITIWEDDWRDKQGIVKSLIAHKLGLAHERRIFARKTTFQRIEKDAAKSFLNSYHIQGWKNATTDFGLFDGDELIAVSSVSIHTDKCGEYLSLDRYATSCVVVGGMGKMLKHFIKEMKIPRVETFAAHEVSDGGMYERLGFAKVSELDPDYMYVFQSQRVHKFNLRKVSFKAREDLKFTEDSTESELAALNNLLKVWDSGKTKYEYVAAGLVDSVE